MSRLTLLFRLAWVGWATLGLSLSALEMFVDDTEGLYRDGVSAYVLLLTGNNNDFEIQCSSYRLGTRMELLHGTELIGTVTNGSYIQQTISSLSPTSQGEYSCIHISSEKSEDGIKHEVRVRSYLTIRVVTQSADPFCTSTVGSRAFIGEYAELYCLGNGGEWRTQHGHFVIYTRIPKRPPLYSCGRMDGLSWEESCNTSYIDVVPFPRVTISRSPSTDPLEFVCVSIPPREVTWGVFGAYGDLLNYHYDYEPLTNTTILINQTAPGRSSLRITESEPGRNRIHTIRCSSYDTGAGDIASVHDTATSTLPGSATTAGTSETPTAATGEAGTTMQDNTGFVVGIVALSIVVLVLGSVICFLLLRKKSDVTNSNDTQPGSSHRTEVTRHNPANRIDMDHPINRVPGPDIQSNPAYAIGEATSVPGSLTQYNTAYPGTDGGYLQPRASHEYTYIEQ